jgi:hypothetical protein
MMEAASFYVVAVSVGRAGEPPAEWVFAFALMAAGQVCQ